MKPAVSKIRVGRMTSYGNDGSNRLALALQNVPTVHHMMKKLNINVSRDERVHTYRYLFAYL